MTSRQRRLPVFASWHSGAADGQTRSWPVRLLCTMDRGSCSRSCRALCLGVRGNFAVGARWLLVGAKGASWLRGRGEGCNWTSRSVRCELFGSSGRRRRLCSRSEEHTSELQSQSNLVCRLLLEKKK